MLSYHTITKIDYTHLHDFLKRHQINVMISIQDLRQLSSWPFLQRHDNYGKT